MKLSRMGVIGTAILLAILAAILSAVLRLNPGSDGQTIPAANRLADPVANCSRALLADVSVTGPADERLAGVAGVPVNRTAIVKVTLRSTLIAIPSAIRRADLSATRTAAVRPNRGTGQRNRDTSHISGLRQAFGFGFPAGDLLTVCDSSGARAWLRACRGRWVAHRRCPPGFSCRGRSGRSRRRG